MNNNKSKLLYVIFTLVFVGIGYFVVKHSFLDPPCANTLSCQDSLEETVDNESKAVFAGQTIEPPKIYLNDLQKAAVLGTQNEKAALEKRIYVDLTTQTLKAVEGDSVFLETKISSGKWYPTPTGEFTIWKKIRSTKMSGGQGASYYYLPNVPYVMFYSNSEVAAGRGFSLHGAYWHNNFGHPMSHGCVNMRTIDAKKIFEWAEEGESGTKIIVYGNTP